MFNILNTAALLKELDKYKFKQLHIHHTWKPEHSNFKGNNHIAMQQSMKNYHVNTNGWSDIGQHLSLFPDGKWVTGRPFNIAPASIKGWNTGALAVEMIGNFDLGHDTLQGEQKRAILVLIKYFIDKYGKDSIKFHREGPGVSKSCPGTSLNKEIMIKEAMSMSEEKDVLVDVKISVHGGKVETVKSLVHEEFNYVPIRLVEALGYRVGYKDGIVTIDYK